MIGTAETLQLSVNLRLDPKVPVADHAYKAQGMAGLWVVQSLSGRNGGVPASPGIFRRLWRPLMNKDLGLAQEAAIQSHSSTPMGALAKSLYQQWIQFGQRKQDFPASRAFRKARRNKASHYWAPDFLQQHLYVLPVPLLGDVNALTLRHRYDNSNPPASIINWVSSRGSSRHNVHQQRPPPKEVFVCTCTNQCLGCGGCPLVKATANGAALLIGRFKVGAGQAGRIMHERAPVSIIVNRCRPDYPERQHADRLPAEAFPEQPYPYLPPQPDPELNRQHWLH